MMSSTTTETLVQERTAHNYKGSLYLLPSDEEESQRYALLPYHLQRINIPLPAGS